MTSSYETILGFDFGEKKIGIASANLFLKRATPLETIHYRSDQEMWIQLDKVIEEWRPNQIVVGIPLNMDGSEQEITKKVYHFIVTLISRYKKPVHKTDERLTSLEAKEQIKTQRQAGKKNKTRKGDVDKIAASIILQQWLNSNE